MVMHQAGNVGSPGGGLGRKTSLMKKMGRELYVADRASSQAFVPFSVSHQKLFMCLRHVFLHMSLYIYNEAFASLDSYFSILNLSCSPATK